MAKANAAPKLAELSKPQGVVIIVTAPGGPRRRAGLDFGKIAVPVALDDISEEQLAALAADPMLTIRPAETVAEPAETA
jgi:hypothetical protein